MSTKPVGFIDAPGVRRLVPEAWVAIAHGQMREKELEGVMLQFIDGATDVLVTSAIIENGLDIPRVNTLLVNRAVHFGPPLEPLRSLVELARLRLRAEALGIESLESEGGAGGEVLQPGSSPPGRGSTGTS